MARVPVAAYPCSLKNELAASRSRSRVPAPWTPVPTMPAVVMVFPALINRLMVSSKRLMIEERQSIPQVVMNFAPTEEQLLIQKTAHDFAEREVSPKAMDLDKTGRWPTEIVA